VNIVTRINRNRRPKEPRTDRETILRLRDAAARFTGLAAFEGALDDLAAAFSSGLTTPLAAVLLADLAARFGASGVTTEGAFGKPFAAVFFAGPGRFNLLL
jgi:predicted ThiF/HesA family dinucleotide-utilizing enzyme